MGRSKKRAAARAESARRAAQRLGKPLPIAISRLVVECLSAAIEQTRHSQSLNRLQPGQTVYLKIDEAPWTHEHKQVELDAAEQTELLETLEHWIGLQLSMHLPGCRDEDERTSMLGETAAMHALASQLRAQCSARSARVAIAGLSTDSNPGTAGEHLSERETDFLTEIGVRSQSIFGDLPDDKVELEPPLDLDGPNGNRQVCLDEDDIYFHATVAFEHQGVPAQGIRLVGPPLALRALCADPAVEVLGVYLVCGPEFNGTSHWSMEPLVSMYQTVDESGVAAWMFQTQSGERHIYSYSAKPDDLKDWKMVEHFEPPAPLQSPRPTASR